jgi:hypothetical protein
MNTTSAVSMLPDSKNALATPQRSNAAVFSSEIETRNHVERMNREREAFGKWWESFNPDNGSIMNNVLCWESWKASARTERPHA